MEDERRGRGRPLGFKLSEETKDKIRCKRIGTRHSAATKEKISRSLEERFRGKDALINSFEEDYKDFPVDVSNWLYSKRVEINDTRDVFSNKRISYLERIEVSYGDDVCRFGHCVTPEFLMILQEDLKSMGIIIDPADLC